MGAAIGRRIVLTLVVVMVLLLAGCGDDDATTTDDVTTTTDDVSEAGQEAFAVGDCVDGGEPVECTAEMIAEGSPVVGAISDDGTCDDVSAELQEYVNELPDRGGEITMILSNPNGDTAACVLIPVDPDLRLGETSD